MRHQLRFAGFVVLAALAFGACKKPKDDGGQKVTIAGNPGPGGGQKSEVQKAKVVSEGDGVVVAEIDGESANLVQPEGAEPGTAVVFPAGTVPTGTLVTVEPATTLADVGTLAELGFASAEQGFLASGAALAITASGGVQPAVPFTVSLALPPTAGSALQDPYAGLAIVYHAKIPGESGYRLGIYPRGQLRIENGVVSFDTQLFGVYQAVVMVQPVVEAKQVVTATAFETKTQGATLPPVSWTSEVAAGEGRALVVTFAVKGLARLVSCKLALDADGAAPVDEVRDVGRELSHTVEPRSDEKHVVYASLTCVDDAGRKSTSDAVVLKFRAAPATVATATDTGPQLDTTLSAVTGLTATPEPGQLAVSWVASQGAAGYVVAVIAGGTVTWTPVDGEALPVGTPLPNGSGMLVADVTATSYLHRNADASDEYTVKVFAYDGERRYAAGAEVTARPSPDPWSRATGFNDSPTQIVKDTSNDKWYVTGNFQTYDDLQSQVVRFGTDWSLDRGFKLPPASGRINGVIPVGDGRIYVYGSFEDIGGVPAPGIARVNADGTLDASFDVGDGPDDEVRAAVLGAGGDLYLGGGFATYGGAAAPRIIRINADGSLDSGFNPGTGMTSTVRALAYDPSNDRVFAGGDFTTYNGVSIRPKIAYLSNTGALVGGFHGSTDGFNGSVNKLYFDDASDRLYVMGLMSSFGASGCVQLCSLDLSGNVLYDFNVQGEVRTIAIDTVNSQVYVGGRFGSFGNDSSVPYLVRSDLNGTRDTGFAPAPKYFVEAVALDGAHVVAGGHFTRVGTTAKGRIARFTTTGALTSDFGVGGGLSLSPHQSPSAYTCSLLRDGSGNVFAGSNATQFDGALSRGLVKVAPTGARDATFAVGEGFDHNGGPGLVAALAPAGGDAVLAAGYFTHYKGSVAGRIVKLTSAGDKDASFDVNPAFDAEVLALALTQDGKIYAGGAFTQHGGAAAARLARLNADGTRDTAFAVGAGFAGGDVWALQLAPSGLYVGGTFTSYQGATVGRIVRLDASGNVDPAFVTGGGFTGGTYGVVTMALDPDTGDLYVGGDFTHYGGQAVGNIVRLNADGSVDTAFVAGVGFNGPVATLALEPGGKTLYVGGNFQSYDGQTDGALALVKLAASGTRDTRFDARIVYSPTKSVNCLHYDAARNELYAGGGIRSAQDKTVEMLVRLDASTGDLD